MTQIAEVTLDRSGQPRIERVVCAVDCGVAVNPDMIRAQMEGGIGLLRLAISALLPAYSASSDWFFPLWPSALWPEQAA